MKTRKCLKHLSKDEFLKYIHHQFASVATVLENLKSRKLTSDQEKYLNHNLSGPSALSLRSFLTSTEPLALLPDAFVRLTSDTDLTQDQWSECAQKCVQHVNYLDFVLHYFKQTHIDSHRIILSPSQNSLLVELFIQLYTLRKDDTNRSYWEKLLVEIWRTRQQRSNTTEDLKLYLPSRETHVEPAQTSEPIFKTGSNQNTLITNPPEFEISDLYLQEIIEKAQDEYWSTDTLMAFLKRRLTFSLTKPKCIRNSIDPHLNCHIVKIESGLFSNLGNPLWICFFENHNVYNYYGTETTNFPVGEFGIISQSISYFGPTFHLEPLDDPNIFELEKIFLSFYSSNVEGGFEDALYRGINRVANGAFGDAVPVVSEDNSTYLYSIPLIDANSRVLRACSLVEKRESEYRVVSIVPMDEAYVMARLYTKPSASWLSLSKDMHKITIPEELIFIQDACPKYFDPTFECDLQSLNTYISNRRGQLVPMHSELEHCGLDKFVSLLKDALERGIRKCRMATGEAAPIIQFRNGPLILYAIPLYSPDYQNVWNYCALFLERDNCYQFYSIVTLRGAFNQSRTFEYRPSASWLQQIW